MSTPASVQLTTKEILRNRARALATEPRTAANGPSITVLEFGLAGERYAVELRYACEVDRFEQLTPVPCTPHFLAGIINVRGRIVAVIDLKTFFELPANGITDLHRAIIVQHQNVEVGLLADYVVGTREIALADLQPALPTLTGIRAEYLRGVAGGRLIVLDAPRILSDPKLVIDDAPGV